MADSLELHVLTPQRKICDETVSQVVAQGALGQFGVLPDHITFLTILEPGPLTFYRVEGGSETLAVKGGYAEVRDNVMTVLADDVMLVGRIDESAARADLERAEAALADAPFGHPENERLSREARWAAARLELARH
jgi:F-type H+-transporting ATPase subunit epsilon